jgi:outer membrane receptor protein involved in Fe transport
VSKNRVACRRALVKPPVGILASAISAILAGVGPSSGQAQEPVQDEIVVTGSRIVRRDLSAPSPIVTLDSERFENTSNVGIEAVLNQLPQFAPGGGQGDGTQFDSQDLSGSAFNTPGAAMINLRGIGTNRNLVLIDGRRAQPVNATMAVDLNSIPTAAIESVEIITGGASAVYGADAIAGVTNFRFKRDFQGIDLDFQSGLTGHGDGAESRFSGLVGGNIGDEGNVMLGVEWAKREAAYEYERDFYQEGWADLGTPTGDGFVAQTYWTPGFGNAPTQQAVDSIFGAGSGVSPFTSFYINPDQSVFKADPTVRYRGPGLPEYKVVNGILGRNTLDQYVSSPLTRYSLFGRGTYEFGDNVTFFAQGNYSSIDVDSLWGFSPAVQIWGANVPYDAAHPVPSELRTLLDSRPNNTAPWQLNRVLDVIGANGTQNTTSVYQVMAGVEGSLRDQDWTWEAYVSQGETTVLSYLYQGFASLARWQELLNAPNYGANYARDAGLGFNISCTSGVPVFGDFPMSQDCIDAVSTRMKNWTEMTQSIAEFNLQGGLAEMRSGELRFAVGVSYRENTFLFEPDPINDAESVADRPIGLFASNDTSGSTDVAEVYGELLVPATERFNLEFGYRHSEYDTAGTVGTYKALFDWDLTESLRLRGGVQRANRAPNIGELYTAPSLAIVGFPGGDPCAVDTQNSWGNVPSNPNRAQVQALCSAIINNPGSLFDADPNAYIGPFGYFVLEIESRRGNPELESEEADTWTLGAVFQRNRWTASVDLYDIDISGAITPVTAYTTYQQCFNADGASNPTYALNDPGGYCAEINRLPDGARFQVGAPYKNLGAISTMGADAQFNWVGDRWGVSFNMTVIDKYETQATADAPLIDSAGTLAEGGQYDWRTFTTVRYSPSEPLSFALTWRHLPEVEDASAALVPATTVDPVDAYDVFDLNGNWMVGQRTTLRFGIDNVLDTDPEIVGADPPRTNAAGSTYPGYYDTLGRRYYVGAKVSF